MTTAAPPTLPPGESGWITIATSAEITTVPREIDVDGTPYVAFRAAPDEPVTVLPALCPHRHVRLAHGLVVDGTLQCPYHGWRFATDGSCVDIPSAGPEASPPPRADLTAPAAVREGGGTVDIRPAADAGPPTQRGAFTNLDPALLAAWHPVAVDSELIAGEALPVMLLDRSWVVRRDATGALSALDQDGQAAHGVCEKFGLVWLTPAAPTMPLLDVPDDEDPSYAGAWLVPERTQSCAGAMADNFLDVAHFPFVHVGTFGAAEEKVVEPFEVTPTPGGFTSVQEQWFDNPEDPGVRGGTRPLRQRRRASYTYRAPFQLVLRLEELDAGAVKTILFFLQPESLTSTRIYTKMVLHGIGGVAVPSPEVVASEVAFEVAVLGEDLALQAAVTGPGLPLHPRDELHVRADRNGVALRKALRDFAGVQLRAGA